jgi:N-acetylornithine carbamoyltransferase
MKSNSFLGRDWIDAELDYTREEWDTLIDVALDLKRGHAMGEDQTAILRNKTLYTMFFNQSLRTRSTFATGIQQLGGFHVDLEPGKTYTPARAGYDIPYKTERIADVARILSRVGDAIAIRMYGPPAYWIYGFANATLKEFAEYAQIPVINMEDDKYHPTQALADLITIKEKFGAFKGLKLTMSWAYSGSVEKPRAVPQSVVLAGTKMGMDVTLAHPKGFELEPAVIDACNGFAADTGGSFKMVNDFEEGFRGADVVYPKAWGSVPCFDFVDDSGTKVKDRNAEEAERLNKASRDWMTTAREMKLTNKRAIYMHCLPADRGQEVSDEVLDGPQSVIIDEAENRLHAHKAIMALLMGGRL